MANASIINIEQPNNKDVEHGLMPCVAAAKLHRHAIHKINEVLQVLDETQPRQVSDGSLDAAIAAESRALQAFLNIVPTSNRDAAAKIEYVLSAPDLVETLPADAMRQFLSALLSHLVAPSAQGTAAVLGRVTTPLAGLSDTSEGSIQTTMHLTPLEVAERLRSSIPTLNRWRSNGTGPAYIKSGGRVLYPLDKLEAFEAASKRTKTR